MCVSDSARLEPASAWHVTQGSFLPKKVARSRQSCQSVTTDKQTQHVLPKNVMQNLHWVTVRRGRWAGKRSLAAIAGDRKYDSGLSLAQSTVPQKLNGAPQPDPEESYCNIWRNMTVAVL
jgi:hypothetical protein